LEEDSVRILRIGVGGARAESVVIPCVLPEGGEGEPGGLGIGAT